MAQRISRRELARRGLIGMAALATPGISLGQSPSAGESTVTDSDLAEVEAMLDRPLGPEARSLMKTALGANRDAYKRRLATKLPENSEPCTLFVAPTVKERR